MSGVVACDRGDARTEASSSAEPRLRFGVRDDAPRSRYPGATLPRLRGVELRAQNDRGVVTVVRPLLRTVTPKDGLRVAVRWLVGAGAPRDVEAKGRWEFERTRFLDTLTVRIGGPDGETTLGARSAPAGERAWYGMDSTTLVVTGEGARAESFDRTWTEPSPDVFARPGRYVIHIAGLLERSTGEPLAFESGAIDLDVVEASLQFLPLEELEAVAWNGVAPRALSSLRRDLTAEDELENRWFWFRSRMGGGSGDEWNTHVLVTSRGEVVAFDERYHFSCLGEGSLVATPIGSVPVETLRPGDSVVGYDLAAEREVTTAVRAVRRSQAEGVIAVGGLRVTGEHPVYANGGWVLASDLQAGDTLLRRNGERTAAPEVVRLTTNATVFDLSVDPPNNFFADGILVHNKAAAQGLPMDWWEWIFDRPSEPGWGDRGEAPRGL